MTTAAKLRDRTVKDLAVMAKRKKVPGWHAMRKDQLVKALVNHARAAAARAARKSKLNGQGNKAAAKSKSTKARPSANRGDRRKRKVLSPRAEHQLKSIKAQLTRTKDLAAKDNGEESINRDRLVVMVRDPFWLHAYWEITRRSIERAKAAMGQHWHASRPVLRLYEVSRSGVTNSARKLIRDVDIHGGVNNWYIDVKDPPKSFQLEIGYLAPDDEFAVLARGNTVSTPRAGGEDSFDRNWAEVAKDFERVYAMSGGYVDQDVNRDLKEVFEEQLRRPMGDPMATQYGLGAAGIGANRPEMNFDVKTELIVHGVTDPDAHVTLRGEPVHLRGDGTFAVRFSLPDRRHVLPVVASSADGVEQRTIVLAVDRNTKVMEPIIRDAGK